MPQHAFTCLEYTNRNQTSNSQYEVALFNEPILSTLFAEDNSDYILFHLALGEYMLSEPFI